jgi:O-antigen/teichoic acid export membrane protein
MDSRMDKLLLGARSSAAITGVYAVADEIAAMPTTELLAPLGRVLFPAFVLKRDGPPEAFAGSVIMAIGVQALVAIPACIGLTLVASDTIFILLGEQWSQMVPLIQIMSITNLLIAIIHSGAYALLATGHVRMLAIVTWLQVLLFFFTAVVVFPGAQANELAEIRLLVVLTGTLVLLGIMFLKIEALSTAALLKSLFRPLLASGLMAVTLLTMHPLMVNFSSILRLLLEIGCGGTIYLTAVIIMWLSAGRPEGPEAYLFKNLIRKS